MNKPQLTLITGARVLAPRPLPDITDLLLAGGRIAALGRGLDAELGTGLAVERIDASDLIAAPGLVDPLVHATGGGGEDGFGSRTPALWADQALANGITTVVSCLGTDAVTRGIRELVAQTYALRAQGLSAYCHTGSYELPPVTLTGSVQSDIVFIEPVIGVGEIALADHRGAQPGFRELARLAAEAGRAGMIAGKAGIVSIHLGDGDNPFELLREVAARTDVPLTRFYPTHANRLEKTFEDGLRYGREGGYLDFTTSTTRALLEMGEVPAADAVIRAVDAGIDPARITLSSDGQASLPAFGGNGELHGLECADVGSLFRAFTEVIRAGMPVDQALLPVTRNPADILGLSHKGRIEAGTDADLILLDPETLEIREVFAGGVRRLEGNPLTVK